MALDFLLQQHDLTVYLVQVNVFLEQLPVSLCVRLCMSAGIFLLGPRFCSVIQTSSTGLWGGTQGGVVLSVQLHVHTAVRLHESLSDSANPSKQ